jgi:hypothetical protein
MSACCDWALALKPKNTTMVDTPTERHIPFFISFPSLKIGGDVERVSRIMHSMTTSESTFYSINTTKFVRFESLADIDAPDKEHERRFVVSAPSMGRR